MEYESDILKRLIKTYGVVGNPRYISEIIKEFIVRGKERFPELFTYQSDWLAHIDEFGLTPEYTVSYTGQHIYAPNTLERPVKRAILSGNTLVNLFDRNYLTTEGLSYTFNNGIYSITSTVSWSKLLFKVNLKNNTKYIFFGITSVADCEVYYRIDGVASKICNFNQSPFIFTTPDNKIDSISIGFPSIVTDATVSYLMLIEYQDGMENWDIPYFEGMQSVKMPVLTTSNEDGTKTNILTVNEPVELRGIGDVKDTLDCLTGEVVERIGEIVLDGTENWSLQSINSNNISNFKLNVSFKENGESICNKLIQQHTLISNTTDEGYYISGGSTLYIRISASKANNVSSFKTWLQVNPITIYYEQPTESIKTVDLSAKDQDNQVINQLSTFEGGTHFTTSSQEGSLLPSLSVDVVTNLEETLRVCSLEGNTM